MGDLMTLYEKRFIFIFLILLAACGQKNMEKQPNILFILIDDMSWNGVGCFGNKYVDTPHIDNSFTVYDHLPEI